MTAEPTDDFLGSPATNPSTPRAKLALVEDDGWVPPPLVPEGPEVDLDAFAEFVLRLERPRGWR